MIGRRVDRQADEWPWLEAGDYGKNTDGRWYCVPPGKEPFSFMGCLGDGVSHHQVVEHEDGTITASPSILITSHEGSWHGFLERGVWREC